MNWFKRKKNTAPMTDGTTPIVAFWRWWETAHDQVLDTLTTGPTPSTAAEVTAHVSAIHPGLVWEISKGRTSEYALIVTAGHDPRARRHAREWLNAAPAPSPTWEYDDMRAAGDINGVLHFADTCIELADVKVVPERVGNTLHCLVCHPAFAHLTDDEQFHLAVHIFQTILGEPTADLWVGAVASSAQAPADAIPLAAIPALAQELQEELAPGGEMNWVLMHGEDPETGPVMVSCLAQFCSKQAPLCDTHLAIEVPYNDQTEQGMPGEGSFDALLDLEEQIIDAAGDNGFFVARLTTAGVRTYHVYVDPTTNAQQQITAVVANWPQGAVSVSAAYDPNWEAALALVG